MSEIKFTIGLDAETRALLVDIKDALLQAHPNCERCMGAVSASMNHIRTGVDAGSLDEAPLQASEPPTAPAPAPEAPAPAATPSDAEPATEAAPAPDTKVYTMDEVRAAVMKVCRMGEGPKEKAKALLQKYAPSLSELPVAMYPDFMAALEAIA